MLAEKEFYLFCSFQPPDTTKAAVSAAATSAPAARGEATHAHATLNASKLVAVRARLFALSSDAVDISEKLRELLGAVADVDALVLAVLVDEVELPQHLEEGHVGARVVDDALGAVLDEELEQLEGLAG